MPYNNFGEYVHNRHPEPPLDPYRMSAEQFAKNVETFLYDTSSPVYMDPNFLAWSIRQYDLSKAGSGRVFDVLDYQNGRDSIDYLKPPLPYPGKTGIEYRVKYTREEFNRGQVPTNADGTQPLVEEDGVYQIVHNPDDGLNELLDRLGISITTQHEEE